MLILTRRPSESIQIAENITVTVLAVKGSQIRLGIQAPAGVTVDRSEIAARKAAGVPVQKVAPTPSEQPPEELYANRTADEWRQLLADEAEEQRQRDEVRSHDAA